MDMLEHERLVNETARLAREAYDRWVVGQHTPEANALKDKWERLVEQLRLLTDRDDSL